MLGFALASARRTGHYAPVTACVVPGCEHAATVGEDWSSSPPLEPIRAYRKGVEMQLAVRDLAVTLTLCAEHGEALAAAGWAAVLAQLDGWGWQPINGK